MAKLYYRYGAMNSGKTTALLQVAHNYEEMGMNIILIKASIDTKANNKVVSRLNIDREVDILLDEKESVIDRINNYINNGLDAIIVDEAQFLEKKQVDELYYLTKMDDIPVICYGLRCDFKMDGFNGSTRLLQIADSIEELKTICTCGKKATQNLRLKNNIPVFEGEQVLIDNSDIYSYTSVCGKCYLKLKKEYEKDFQKIKYIKYKNN